MIAANKKGRQRKPSLRGAEERNAMVCANQGLIWTVAYRLHDRYPVPVNAIGGVEELVAVGQLILLRAAERFDDTKGFAFSTFVMRALFNSLSQHIREQAEVVRRPSTLKKDGNERHSCEPLYHGCDPIVEPESLSVDEQDQRSYRAAVIADLLRSLTPRQQKIMKLRYGIGCEPHTYLQIAAADGTSKQNIQLIVKACVMRLRRAARRLNVTLEAVA